MKQIEIFGEGTCNELPRLLKEFGTRKIFLVTGTGSFEKSGADSLLEGLSNEIEVRRFNVTTELPELNFIKHGIEELKRSGCDTVVAVGGGNIIDTAKAVNILSKQNASAEVCINTPLMKYEKGLPLVAVPTTSGSGSEATHFAVVYSGGKKYSLADEFILPDAAIVDPLLTYSLGPYLTAVSGIDVFCQAVESSWACGSTKDSKAFSGKSISLSTVNLVSAVNSPSEVNRRNMSLASNLAGKAINISKTTAPHAVSYTMTRNFGIPHGQAVCLTLAEFLQYNYEVNSDECNDIRGVNFVRESVEETSKLIGGKDVYESFEKIKELIQMSGLRTGLRELGIVSYSQLETIAGNTNPERLSNNPRKITYDSLLEILKRVY